MPPKRLSRFTEKLQNEFTFLKKVHSDNDYDVFCTICSSPFSVSHGGRSDITDHLKTKKHKTAKNAASFSSVRTFFNNLKADDTSLKLAAKELTFVYHTISHNQSFNSMNCTSSLIRTLFNEKQFTAARTKSRDIAVNVLTPFVVKITKIDLEKANFVSILVDASNHKYMKFVPVIVRYFSSTLGVQNKILEFSNLPGETAEIIYAHIVKVLNENALSDKIISFSADNTNTNFGGMLRKGKNNVFLKLKQTLNRNILGMGCCAHIIHNSIQYASDCLPVDVDSIVCKIFGFFHIYTVRVENLKEFCDDVDVQYKDLLSHSKTRWLSLFPAIERIISMFDGLKSYFLSQSNCPCILKNFFEDECSLLWFKFLHSQLKTFNNYIKKVETQNLSAIELMFIMENLMIKIQNKKEEKFQTTEILNLLKQLEDDGFIKKNFFDDKCYKFYELCHSYLKNWSGSNTHNLDLKSMSWVTLTSKSLATWENAKNSIAIISSTSNIAIDEEAYFEQFKLFENIFTQQNDEWHEQDLVNKWLFIFNRISEAKEEYSSLFKVVEFCFTLPGSNAAVERVFSLMNSTWTKSRNKLDVKTVEASLLIKTSFENKSCEQFYEDVLENKDLLKKVHNSSKYSTKPVEDSLNFSK